MWGKMDLTNIAESLLFGNIRTSKELDNVIEFQWQYRKNKNFTDVKKAIDKGLKMGRGKTEHEIDWVALYLNDVFKTVKTK